MEWMVEHAAFVQTRFTVGHDSKTGHERLGGRKFRGRIVDFGEQVWARLARPQQRGKQKKKLAPRWTQATWVGITQRSGEHKVVTASGRAVRVRTIKRFPIETRWLKDKIMAIEATPRRPNPSDPQQDDPEPIVQDEARAEAPHQEPERGVEQEPPEVRQPQPPREFQLSKKILDKYGWWRQ